MRLGTKTSSYQDEHRLPDGWRWVRLADVCEKQCGVRDPRLEPNSTFRYVDISSVDNLGKYIREAQELLGKEAPSRARQIVRVNDVIVATTRPNLNAVALVPGTYDNQICSTGFCVLRAGPQLLPEYLFYFVRHECFVNALTDLVKGALYPAVNDTQVKTQTIPLAPLSEQRRIVRVLRGQMAAVEKARKAAEERVAAIKAMPAAYLRQVYPSPGDCLPNGWRWVRLRDEAALLPSRSIASEGDTQVQAVTTACLTESGLSPAGVKSAQMRSRDVQVCTISVGEILIARSNTSELVGRASLYEGVPANVVASDLTIRVQTMSALLPGFLAGYLSALFVRRYWCEEAGGASGSMKKITRNQVEDLRVPLPPLREQQMVADSLKKQMAEVDKARAAAEAELEAINALPAAILRRAFMGEL